MTMAYDGTLVMPSNYITLTEDEMMYVEGELTWSQAKDRVIGVAAIGEVYMYTVKVKVGGRIKWTIQ